MDELYVLPPVQEGRGGGWGALFDRGADTEQPPLRARLLERDAIGGGGCASVTAENGPRRPEQAALVVRSCLGWVGVCLT